MPEQPSTTIQLRLWDDLLFGRLPLAPEERTHRWQDSCWQAFAQGLSPLSLLLGTYVALYTSIQHGLPVLLTGIWIGSGLATLLNYGAQRYGLDSVDSQVPLLGRKGVVLLVMLWLLLLCLQISCMLHFAGQLLTAYANTLWHEQITSLATAVCLLALLATLLLVHSHLDKLDKWHEQAVVGLNLLLVLLAWHVLSALSWQESVRIPPLTWLSDSRTTHVNVFEHALGFALSFAYPLARLQRQAVSKRQGLFGTWFGFASAAGLTSGLGLAAALLYRNANPVGWLSYMGGKWLALLCVCLMSLACLAHSAQLCRYTLLLLRFLPICKHWPNSKLLLAIALPMAGLMVLPDTFTTIASTLGSLWSSILCPLVAVALFDSLWLRRQSMDISQLFERATTGKYHYQQGYNLCAIWSIACGILVGIRLHPPFTFAIHPMGKWLGISLPAMVVAILLYWLLQRWLLLPQQLGGYRPGPIPMRLFQSDLD